MVSALTTTVWSSTSSIETPVRSRAVRSAAVEGPWIRYWTIASSWVAVEGVGGGEAVALMP